MTTTTALAKIKAALTPARRRWIYRTVSAIVALFVVYGLVNGQQSAALLLVANAALGLADAKVTTT